MWENLCFKGFFPLQYRPPLRRQSAKFKSEETQDIEEPTKPAQPKEKVDNKRFVFASLIMLLFSSHRNARIL